MSWYCNGYGQYVTVTNDRRLFYSASDHAYGIWFRRSGDSHVSSGGALFDHYGRLNCFNRLYVNDSDHRAPNQLYYLTRNNSEGKQVVCEYPNQVIDGEWYHVLVQRKNNIQYMYVNGVKVSEVDASEISNSEPDSDLMLGRSSAGANYKGSLAEFFKFNRALTDDEISSLYKGMKPTELRGSIDDLVIYIPADSDKFVDYHNRFEVKGVSVRSNNDVHPPVYDSIPEVKSYINPVTKVRVEVTGGPYLDIMRHTPYGLQVEGPGNDCFDALDWAIRNQSNPDPKTRTSPDGAGSKKIVPGGPPGCFKPIIGGNDVAYRYWNFTRTLWIPNGRGGSLEGVGMGYDFAPTQQGRFSRLKYTPQAGYENRPAIMHTSARFKMGDFTLVSHTQNEGAVRRPIGIQTKLFRNNVDHTSNPLWDPVLGIKGDSPQTENHWSDMAICGFDTGIRVEDSERAGNQDFFQFRRLLFKRSGIGIHIVNEQSLDAVFEDIQDAEEINIYFAAGGNCTIFAPAVVDPNTTFLKIKNSGKFNGSFSIYDIAVDPRTQGQAYLVDIEGEGLASRQVTLNFWGGINQAGAGGTNSAGERWSQEKFLRIGNNCNVNFYGFRGIGPITVWGGGNGSRGWNNKIFRPAVNFIASEFWGYNEDNLSNVFQLEPGAVAPEYRAMGCKYIATGDPNTTYFPEYLTDVLSSSSSAPQIATLKLEDVKALIDATNYTTLEQVKQAIDEAGYISKDQALEMLYSEGYLKKSEIDKLRIKID